ncbi:MAG: glycosyl hydrolase [Bacteroidia bacterium]|nr:glycosyl hydrolase [Bacteroidia bacterium]
MKNFYLIFISTFVFINLLYSQNEIKSRFDILKKGNFNKVPYENIGPTIMSGRVTDIEVNPAKPEEMFVAYASGGVWYSNNNGQSFKPIFDNQHSITIGDIAVNWNNFTLWVGTGESNSSRSSYAGTGVYYTNDTGNTWKYCGLPESHHIGKVLLHPTKDNIIYVAVLGHLNSANEERGVYKTVDFGKTWEKVLYLNDKTGAIDLCFDPQNPETVIAAMWERIRYPYQFIGAGSNSGIYITKNGGISWEKIFSGNNIGRIGLGVYNESGKTGLYALIDDQNPNKKIISDTSELNIEDIINLSKKPIESFLKLSDNKLEDYLRDNNFPEKYTAKTVKELIKKGKNKIIDIANYIGDANNNLFNSKLKGALIIKTESLEKVNWEVMNDSIDNFYYTYGYYFGQIRVSPVNKNEIYILGVVLAKSDNGGKSLYKLNDENVHADYHSLWINPDKPTHFVCGNDGGVNISYDKGRNWIKCNSPSVGQFYSVSLDEEEPYNIYGGMQDNGVWKGSRNYIKGKSWHQYGKYPWQPILGGDGMQTAIDTKQKLIFTGYQFGNYFRINNIDNSRKYITPRHELGELPYRFNWQTPIILSKHVKNTLYLGGNYLFRSFDNGDNWQIISPDLTSGKKEGNIPFGTLTCIDESKLKFGLIYTGSDDGNINITQDGGNSWQNISVPEYSKFWVTRVQASIHKISRVYATFSGLRNDVFVPMIAVSDDFGKYWRKINGNLPMEPINVIREDFKNKNILYIGTDNGLYLTFDGGKNWEHLSSLPRVAVHDLVINNKTNELIVGTHGRSIIVISLNEINNLDTLINQNELFLYQIPENFYSQNWGSKPDFWEPVVEKEIKIAFFSTKEQPIDIVITDSAGVIILLEKIIADKGVNYYQYKFTANENLMISKFLKKGKNDKYYLTPGLFTFRIQTKNKIVEKKLELKLK